MAMIRFNRWLSSSSFSRRFFDGSFGGSGSAESPSRSSTSPISRKFLTDRFEVFGSLAIGAACFAGLAAPLAGGAAQLAAPPPQQPFHHEVAARFLLCRWASQPLVPGVAAQPPFHQEVASRFLLCRWVSICLARNHNSMHRQTPAERASPTPQDRRGDRSGSSSRRARYYLDTRPSLLSSRCRGNRVSLHLK